MDLTKEAQAKAFEEDKAHAIDIIKGLLKVKMMKGESLAEITAMIEDTKTMSPIEIIKKHRREGESY